MIMGCPVNWPNELAMEPGKRAAMIREDESRIGPQECVGRDALPCAPGGLPPWPPKTLHGGVTVPRGTPTLGYVYVQHRAMGALAHTHTS